MSKVRHSHALKQQHGFTVNPTLEDAIDYASFETRVMLLDSLACTCHNEGHGMVGNRPEFDLEWLARDMWQRVHPIEHPQMWEHASAEVKKECMDYAAAALAALPELFGRISRRYLGWESALRSMQQVEHAALVAKRNLYVEKLPK